MLALLWQRNSDNTATCCCGTCRTNSNSNGSGKGCIGRWKSRARLGQGHTKGPGLGDMDGLEDEGEPVVPVCPCGLAVLVVPKDAVGRMLYHTSYQHTLSTHPIHIISSPPFPPTIPLDVSLSHPFITIVFFLYIP